MKSRVIQMCGVVLFALIIGFTTLQTFSKLLPEGQLHGVTADSPRPTLTWRTWWKGQFQEQYESWIAQRIGFKPFWVRTENQINFSLNGRITANETNRGTQVVLGRENWLFEKSYVESYLGRRQLVDVDKIERVVWGIQQLQQELARRGIAFLLVISPSKAVTYPEYLPERFFRAAIPPARETNYTRTVAVLEDYGIARVDGRLLFDQLKLNSDYPLFAKGGTHWNQYSAFQVLAAMIESLNPRMARADMPLPTLQAVKLKRPQGADTDLGGLINIWTAQATEAPTPYPQLVPTAAQGSKPPRVLVVGSSFVWTLIDQMTQAEVYEELDFLYYYRRRVTYPGQSEAPFDPLKADWQGLLHEKDAVIMEINEAALPHFNTRFIKDALRNLK